MKIVNLGILAHVDAGKTTLTEAILHLSGAVRTAGRVDDGTTITDSMAVEKQRGITVRAATVSFQYRGVKVNILDTPGHMDFIAEVERSLRVLDAAVLVLSAREGVQTQTRRLFSALKSLRIPTLFFVNKIDRAGADPDGVVAQIRALLTDQALPMQIPADSPVSLPLENLTESLLDADDELLARFVEEGEITAPILEAALCRAVKACAVYPVYFGAALREVGVPALMDAVAGLLPGADAAEEPLVAELYKVERLPRLGRVCYARVWSGALKRGASLKHGEDWLRVKQLMALEDARMKSVDEVPPGDIAALVGLDRLMIGDVVTDGAAGKEKRRVKIAEPLLYSNVSCAEAERGSVLSALYELADEDPLLQVEISDLTNEILVRIFGEVQMEIVVTLMRERFGLEITLGEPRTVFREKPAGTGEGGIAWGETNYQAALAVKIEPCDSEGIEYVSQVDYGYLTQSFQNAAREGILEALRHGACGWQVFGARVTLTGATFNSVSSTPADFRNIAPLAAHRALAQSGVKIYEPYVAYALRVPADCAARAAYDITVLRGAIENTYAERDLMVYEGTVPLETSRAYPRALASYTRGLGMLDTRPADYRPYPGDASSMARAGYDPTNFEKYLLQKAGRL
jgi:ribosomal protection tetracycline resistance protein